MVSDPYYKATILCKGPLLLSMKLHLPIGSQHDKSGGKWTFLALLLMGVITLLVAVGSTNKSVGVIQETGSTYLYPERRGRPGNVNIPFLVPFESGKIKN